MDIYEIQIQIQNAPTNTLVPDKAVDSMFIVALIFCVYLALVFYLPQSRLDSSVGRASAFKAGGPGGGHGFESSGHTIPKV